MDTHYWKGRWERGETGWHQEQFEPDLVDAWKDLSPRRIFVPLCGKSVDMIWLKSQGHDVIGVEASARACRDFFEENGLHYTLYSGTPFNRWESPKITLLEGDFFALTPQILGAVDAVYDRAALIALPSELRKQYAKKMLELVFGGSSSFAREILQIILRREPADSNGPPFSLSQEELEGLYSSQSSSAIWSSSPAATEPRLEVCPVSSERLEEMSKPGSSTYQEVFVIRPKSK